MPDQHAALPDAGRISHFDIDARLPTDAQADAIAFRYLAWVIPSPAVSTVGQVPIPWHCTVLEIKANVQDGTSATFNIEERGTLGSAGTNILTSDMAADTTGETETSAFDNTSLSANNYLAVDISAVSGAVTDLTIRLKVRI